MIPILRPEEPPDFDQRVREPGLKHLRQKQHDPGQPPRNSSLWDKKGAQGQADYWREARDELNKRYGQCCVYSCFYLNGERVYGDTKLERSIDHFKPRSKFAARLAYEWINLRLAWRLVNSYKADKIIPKAHDPTEMTTNLVKLQRDGDDNWKVVPDPELEDQAKDEIAKTIDDLGLNKETIIKARNACVEDFRKNRNNYSDDYMKERQPFIYRELKQLGWI